MPIFLSLGTSALLLLALLPFPYGYYTFLRIVATITFGWAAYASYQDEGSILPWIYGLFAIIFNPLIPVHLTREIWAVIDIAAAGFLLATSKYLNKIS
ncbi:hypothetical protein BOV89_10655 [Solemya velum gill symbiont]|uniref:DUF6804 family protein n=1 Tax=Solemya velum gill symbiont TaxID=2340 RepID=UPI000997013A|nr:hypothetical protein BOV89_10655 [Solemya velum gill symbiont]